MREKISTTMVSSGVFSNLKKKTRTLLLLQPDGLTKAVWHGEGFSVDSYKSSYKSGPAI